MNRERLLESQSFSVFQGHHETRLLLLLPDDILFIYTFKCSNDESKNHPLAERLGEVKHTLIKNNAFYMS